VCVSACVDSYSPPVKDSDIDYLVIDGFLNSGVGPTTIKLTHTLNIKDGGKARVEKGALLTVEGTDNSKVALAESQTGVYSISQLSLKKSEKYRLRVKTVDNTEYISEYLEVKKTPPIDGVVWSATDEGVQINVNTHDPSGNTRYYQWEFEETWHYRSEFCTNLQYKNGTISYMDPYIDIHDCWRNEKPVDKTHIASSFRLSEDVIYHYPLTFVPAASGKMGVQYSILVRQHALSKDGYSYYDRLKKNTEQLGSIFDAQPSDLTGNFQSVNKEKIAIGFLSIYDIEEKRIFITKEELPASFGVLPREYCFQFTIDSTANYVRELTQYYDAGLILPINPPDSTPMHITLLNIPYAPKGCVDCRTAAGTNVKPSFWPEINAALGCF